jgi:hypothetical protein
LIITRKLTRREQAKAKEDLANARSKVQLNLNDEAKLVAKLLQFKLRLREHLKQDHFNPK